VRACLRTAASAAARPAGGKSALTTRVAAAASPLSVSRREWRSAASPIAPEYAVSVVSTAVVSRTVSSAAATSSRCARARDRTNPVDPATRLPPPLSRPPGDVVRGDGRR
jgi:hypothetical protein